MPALQTPKSGPLIRKTTDGVSQTRRHASRCGAPRGLPQPEPNRAADETLAARAAVLQERARIARELHDSVSQTLYAITLTASRARSLLKQSSQAQKQKQSDVSEAQRIVEELLQLASTGQSELRALLTNIRSDPLIAGGLIEGLVHLAADVQAHDNIDVHVQGDRELVVPAAVKEVLLLITREALHNIVKHASATTVEVTLDVDPQRLVLLIADDGRGFDPTTPRPGHFGLQSMRERAASVGAVFELDSLLGVGSQVRVSVPHAMGL